MEQSSDVVNHISTLLDSAKYKEALSVPNEEKYVKSFKDNCWDLISVIVGKIQNDTIVLKPSLYGACEELLSMVVQKSTPEEALLEFIEQIEVAKNDAQFSIILPPLQTLLTKLTAKRGRSLEWCLNSISTYIDNIPTPEYNLEGKERLLMDCDNNIRRIAKVFSILPPFYKPFVEELNKEPNIKTKEIITAFLISLLGKPMIYIDLDQESNAQSEVRACCNTIIQDICCLEKNIMKFTLYLEICRREKKPKSLSHNDDQEEMSPYDHREKINMTTLAGLFYLVYADNFNIPDTAIPQVYSITYIVNTVMLAVIHLLSLPEYGPLAKAMSLCKVLLNRFTAPVSYSLLTSAVHYDLIKGLVNIAIYSTYESIRKSAVNLISLHINKFDYKGRCALIKYLLDSSNHTGMIGYAITLFKNSVDEAFKEPEMQECFTGAQLMSIIKKICHLPHGAESDLVELADQIISSLNFLRYLALKDVNNVTGIRECFSMIDADYLEKLRTGLNMSKAHYIEKLKEIEEGKKLPKENVNISVTVGGNVLDQMPAENKKQVIHTALNAFHLIEGLVARVTECININMSNA